MKRILVFSIFGLWSASAFAAGGVPPASSDLAAELTRLHAAFTLVGDWQVAADRYASNTNSFPEKLTDVTGPHPSIIDPWGRPVGYDVLDPGSYRIEIQTPEGPLTYVRLAFTRVPAALPDGDKVAALRHTLKNIQHALELELFDENEYPEQLSDLPRRHFPNVWPLSTPWGQAISYRRNSPQDHVLEAPSPYGLFRIESGMRTKWPVNDER